MIIWINGAFGVGKTQVAYELHRRIENSYIFDPEITGMFIRDNIPEKCRMNDFQDYQMWREFNVKILKYISKTYDGTVIVPMTITNVNYFSELVDELRKSNIKKLKHFTLIADKEIILKRLKSRGEKEKNWVFDQVDRCIESHKKSIFREHIDTNQLTVDDICDIISSKVNIEMKERRKFKLLSHIDRYSVWKKHIKQK